jgi:hypothetical protein
MARGRRRVIAFAAACALLAVADTAAAQPREHQEAMGRCETAHQDCMSAPNGPNCDAIPSSELIRWKACMDGCANQREACLASVESIWRKRAPAASAPSPAP